MKTWVAEKVVAVLMTVCASGAHAREAVDLSKALSVAEQDKHEADKASVEKIREISRRPTSKAKDRIVVDLSNLEK